LGPRADIIVDSARERALIPEGRAERSGEVKFDSITATAVIPAEPNAVYAAWMSSRGHSEMTGSGAAVTARVGAKFSAWDGYISGKTLELKPPSRILQSWRTTEFAAEDPDSMLEVLLEKARGGTKVTLKHTSIPAGHGAEYKKGWIDFYFKPMKEYFQKKA
jgi:activator of HSP90 ATPase